MVELQCAGYFLVIKAVALPESLRSKRAVAGGVLLCILLVFVHRYALLL